ncbi:MAG: acetyl-CoA carboxylase, biotin carboxylase subunit [Thermoplasmata archaeon]|jgi:acetyl-CoA carboxylase biotin carboxylase subunit|nr:acetyl-CoA carboxylase, biotin carboxylase subunit [Thermoplasmata archaeon]
MKPLFRKILVANRGEIALRVMRTARELGIQTVAIHSPQDAKAPHVRFADESYLLGNEASSTNYLNIPAIVELAQKVGADAVHPGYGFLSERSEFATALAKAGVKFIGPPPKPIDVLGDKVASKVAARRAKVPVVPGKDEFVATLDEAREVVKLTGYPVIIKAAFGGGGMGMQVVQSESELAGALAATQRQAKAAFGRGEVFIEKFITRPRHIEIQFLADEHGNVVHFGERECSVQRRHQKLIEEAPSPIVKDEDRARVGASVCQLAKDVGYWNAGTAEFLYEEGKFYFNEVNTRLQVEHPVTEQVYGIDLVREQIRIAAGEPLGYDQKWVDARRRGWAIECRINAEDPRNKFMPTPGLIARHVPPNGNGVRVDTYLYSGFQVPSTYDSMVAKLICYGADRPEAIRKMRRALAEYDLGNLVTNRELHQVIFEDEAFCAGDMTTKFLDERRILDRLMGVEEAVTKETKVKLAALAAALAQEPGGIDSLVQKAYQFKQSAATNVGVDEFGRRRLSPWGQKGRREAIGGLL